MKSYTNADPVFSDTIQITEITDPAHADLINEAPIQLLQNTLVLSSIIGALMAISISDTTLILPNSIAAYYQDETLFLPDGMVSVEDETLELSTSSILGSLPGGGESSGSYVLPIASGTQLGGIKVGSGLDITDDGVLSADLSFISKEDAEAIVANGTEDMTDQEIDECFSDE